MNTPITIGLLLQCLAALIGIVAMGLGALSVLASMMSSNPMASDRAARDGCAALVVGLVVFVGAVSL